MSRFFRCDGCGGEVQRPGAQGRRSEAMVGDDVPPVEFDWCGLCARAAFRGVAAEAASRRRQLSSREMLSGPLSVPQDATRVVEGPAAHVTSWLPRRSQQRVVDLESTRVMGEPPR